MGAQDEAIPFQTPGEPSAGLSRTVQHPPDSCAICLEPISERAITAPCNHVLFDYLCLLTWLLDHDAKCPLCKTQVVTVSYDFCSPTDFKTFQIPETSKAPPSFLDRPQNRRQIASETNLALVRRKHIYRHRLYSLHIGANRISRHRNFTPQTFAASTVLQSRARKWLRRELGVFDFLSPEYSGNAGVSRQVNNSEFLLEYIMTMLRTVDIKGSSGRAEDLLQEFLGRDNARLFLHELEAWLRSPYNDIGDWDQAAQYPEVEELNTDDVLDRRK